MTAADYPIAIALETALKTPLPEGQNVATLMQHGTMRLLYYAPRGTDLQKPHNQDELYMVANGMGTFFCNERRTGFAVGDVLFAPAGAEHRFENFSDDFGAWVIFYGPKGGEH